MGLSDKIKATAKAAGDNLQAAAEQVTGEDKLHTKVMDAAADLKDKAQDVAGDLGDKAKDVAGDQIGRAHV